MLLAIFLIIVLSPCLVAYLGAHEELAGPVDDPPAHPVTTAPAEPSSVLLAMLEEVPLGENLVIRSFPKGLAQRRILVQDTVRGIRLTIAQLRERVRRAGIAARQMVAAFERARESRAALLKRLAEQARANWMRSRAQRAGALHAAYEEHGAWADPQTYDRLRWQEMGAEERDFRAA